MTSRLEKLRWWALGLWLTVVGCYLAALWSYGTSPLQVILGALDWLKTEPLAPLVYVLLFVGRPIIMLPASLLSVVAGHCFGAVGGEFWAMFASCCAAAAVYPLGAIWGPRLPAADDPASLKGLGARWQGFLQQVSHRGLEATIGMRLAFFPYEPVSFLCGSMRVPLGSFLLGTFLGNLPTTTSCVLFGAGIQGDFHGQLPRIDWRYQIAALLLLVLAIVLNRWVKRRHTSASEPDPAASNRP